MAEPKDLSKRFRGYYPVIIDVETGGFHSETDALLEVAAVTLTYDSEGNLIPDKKVHCHIEPFKGLKLNEDALAFNGIKPHSALRNAVSEAAALTEIFQCIRKALKTHDCHRAILVGHNAHFDHGFIRAAVERSKIKRNPFHPFSNLDTVSLSALCLGHTVLAKACYLAGISFDAKEAHSAIYDAEKTAELFCHIVNQLKLPHLPANF